MVKKVWEPVLQHRFGKSWTSLKYMARGGVIAKDGMPWSGTADGATGESHTYQTHNKNRNRSKAQDRRNGGRNRCVVAGPNLSRALSACVRYLHPKLVAGARPGLYE